MNNKYLSDKLSDLRKWQERQQQFLVDILQSESDSTHNRTEGTEFAENDFIDENNHYNDYETRKAKLNVLPRIDECEDLSDQSTEDGGSAEDHEVCEETPVVSASQAVVDVDSCPVVPGIDGKRIKTFEDLIAEKLRDSNKNQDSSPCVIKRPFLKKGEGMKKFQSLGTKKDISTQKAVKFRNPKPRGATPAVKSYPTKKVPEVGTHCEPPVPTHRKVQRICNQNIQKTIPQNAVQRKKLDVLPTVGRIEKKFGKNFPTQNYVIKEWVPEENEATSSDDFAIHTNYFDNPRKREFNLKSNDYSSTDVAHLERLLDFIQIKKDALRKKIEKVNLSSTSSEHESEPEYDRKLRKKRSKKKPLVVEEHRLIADLSQPTENHYASKLKEEIKSLERKLSSLQEKCCKNEQEMMPMKKKLCEVDGDGDGDVTTKLFGEVSNLREQISLLVNRINRIELKDAQKTGEDNKSNAAKVKTHNKPCIIKHSKDLSPNLQKLDIQSDGNSTTVTYENGDQMTVCNDNISIYKYASNGATQTTFPDGLRVIEFPNGQIERIYKNGIKHIYYPNQFQRIINPNGSEEIITEDGTMIRISSEGNEIVDLPNGEREIRTKDFKKREYTNGTVKVVYNDGTQETRYSNGRLKIKDADGNVVVDSFIRTTKDL